MPVVKEWAAANGIRLDIDQHCLVTIRATAAQVAAFLEHVYGRADAAAKIADLDQDATWLLEIPLMPMALTRSSNERVEIPWM